MKWIALIALIALLGGAAMAEPVPQQTPAPQGTVYQLNDYSKQIKVLQLRLMVLGYLQGDADGWFGTKTKSAVKRFQVVNALEPSGAADEETFALLLSEDAKPSPKVLMTLRKLRERLSENTLTKAKFDLSDMAIEEDSASGQLNNHVKIECKLLANDVVEVALRGKSSVELPFNMLLVALGADSMDALDAVKLQGECVIGIARVRYAQDENGVQTLIAVPDSPETAASATNP